MAPSGRRLRFCSRPSEFPNPRIGAVGADDQIGREAAAVRQHQLALRGGRGRAGTGGDDRARPLRRGGERVDHALAHDAVDPARRRIPAMHRQDTIAIIPRLARMGDVRARDGVVAGPQRFQHAKSVLVDVDSGSIGPQRVGALVHLDVPAALRQCAGRGEAGKTRADDFDAPLLAHSAVRFEAMARCAVHACKILPWPAPAGQPYNARKAKRARRRTWPSCATLRLR